MSGNDGMDDDQAADREILAIALQDLDDLINNINKLPSILPRIKPLVFDDDEMDGNKPSSKITSKRAYPTITLGKIIYDIDRITNQFAGIKPNQAPEKFIDKLESLNRCILDSSTKLLAKYEVSFTDGRVTINFKTAEILQNFETFYAKLRGKVTSKRKR